MMRIIINKIRRIFSSLIDLLLFPVCLPVLGLFKFSNDLFLKLLIYFFIYEVLLNLWLWKKKKTLGQLLMRIKLTCHESSYYGLRFVARCILFWFYFFVTLYHAYFKANPYMDELQSTAVMNMPHSLMTILYYLVYVSIHADIIYMLFSRSNQYLHDRLLGLEIQMD